MFFINLQQESRKTYPSKCQTTSKINSLAFKHLLSDDFALYTTVHNTLGDNNGKVLHWRQIKRKKNIALPVAQFSQLVAFNEAVAESP